MPTRRSRAMTPTSVASSTPPTARSPTRCTCSTGSSRTRSSSTAAVGAAVGGTTTAGNAVGSNPGGFVFQDRESDVEAVFAKNLPFMLDLVRSAPTPDQPVVAHRGERAGLRADGVPDLLRQAADRRGQRAARAGRGHGALAGRGLLGRADGLDVGVHGRRALRPAGRLLPPHARLGHRLQRGRPGSGVVHGGRQDVGLVHVHGVGGRAQQPRADPVRRGLHAACRRTPRRPPARRSWRPTSTRWPTPASPPTSTTSTLRVATMPTCSACSATTAR